ncbi:MAG TPA: TonB-dependent receptor [Candidatus Acidoferrales bacterium]|jgi:outer membrane receptor protein involved in Fe transport|nr:TonB-dependent receptor [Candidatus Acidoferrales bacterium]
MSARSALLAALVIALILACADSAFSQITVAQLNGSVRDESGAAVKSATLTLRETSTNASYATTSNDSGFYVIPNLPPGQYELTVTFTGFATLIDKGIVLTVGQTATVDVTLKVATQSEQVTVTTEVPEIEPTKTEISQVINSQQIQDLPISGRQFTDFALLTAGVATGRTSLQSTITEFETTRISFAGMRDLSNMVTVDGADNVNTATGSQRSTPPQESVQEFRVVNNAFGAEYGRALGGIVNIVTKSGTNTLHGSIYDYLQNNATDARSLLQPAPDPYVLRQNQFGGAIGGPIKKDKIFFFTNYEGQRRAESPTFPGVLYQNLDLINAAKAALGIAPENLNVLKTKDNDYGIAKLDYQVNSNNHFSLRYNIEDGRDLNQLVGSTLDGGGIGAPSSGHNLFLRDQSLVGDLATTLKPDLVNTFLAQYGRRHYNFPGVTGEPNLDVPNTLLFGHNFGVLDAIYESRFQITDSIAWVKGNHVAKFGVDYNYVNNFVIWPGFTPMRIVLPGLNCLVDFANFVNPTAGIASNPADGPCPTATPPFFPTQPGAPFGPNNNDQPLNGVPIAFWGAPVGTVPNPPSGQLPTPPPIPTNWQNAYLPTETINFSETLNHSYYGFYAQDQWRVKPSLTINYGLRYDFETGLSKQINPHYNGVQPRVGLAWSPNSKTVVRAGFGLFDDRYNLSFLFITQPQRPVIIPGETLPGIRKGANTATWVLNQLTPGAAGFPSDAAKTLILTGQVPDQWITGTCPPSCTAGAGMVQHDSKIPYSEQANLEIDRQIGSGLTISAGYIWVAAHHLVRAENLNVCPPFGAAASTTVPNVTPGIPACPPAEAPPAGWPAGKAFFYNGLNPGGSPAYSNSGLLYYTDNTGNSVYNGLTLQVTERFRKNFTLNANYTFSHTLDDGTFTTFVSTPQDLYDRSLERANSNQDVRHRFVANFSVEGPKDSFLRNFTFSNIVTLQSPRPFTLFVGFDANGDTNPVTDRVGLSSRNSYYGDDLYSWDLRVARYFPFKERYRLDLMVDVFNALNRPNVDEVTSVYGAAVFCGSGAAPKRYKDAATIATQEAVAAFDAGTGPPTCPLSLGPVPAPPVPNGLFGAPRTMLNPRQFQFAAKFSF